MLHCGKKLISHALHKSGISLERLRYMRDLNRPYQFGMPLHKGRNVSRVRRLSNRVGYIQRKKITWIQESHNRFYGNVIRVQKIGL